jgi:hypothetical protein
VIGELAGLWEPKLYLERIREIKGPGGIDFFGRIQELNTPRRGGRGR